MPINPGGPGWEEKVEFMRADLESGMTLTKIIESTKKRFIEDGRDFDAEFKKWRKEKYDKK